MDLRNAKFGSHFMLVKDNKKFFDLLLEAFKKISQSVQMGFVKYYDRETYNGALTPFHKSKESDYQKEFRFLIRNKDNNPIRFQIGSLEGIAQIFDTSDLEKLTFSILHDKS